MKVAQLILKSCDSSPLFLVYTSLSNQLSHFLFIPFSSVHQLVVSSSLRPHELQHTRPPSPSPSPRVYSNSCPSSWWCHPASHPLSSPSPPAPNPSQHQGLFQRVNSSHEVAKYWSFSNEHPGLISFRMDWLDLLVVQGTLKSLLQHHSLKASIFSHSAFFTVQLSHPYMTTGKTIALTRRTLIDKVMSLLFNMLSRLVITFLPRSKHILISWLQSLSAVILEPQKIKSDSFHCLPIYFPWSDGTRCHDLSLLNAEL